MKSNNFWRNAWQLLYPIGAHFLITLVVSFIAMFICCSLAMTGIPSDQLQGLDFKGMTELITEVAMKEYLAQSIWITVAASLISIPIMLLFMKKDVRDEYKAHCHVTYDTVPVWIFIAAFVLGITAGATGNVIISLSGLADAFVDELEQMDAQIYQGSIIVQVIAVGILAPIAEELVFRGLVYHRMRYQISFIPAMIMSALIFAMYHGNITQGVYAFLLGCILALVYEKTQNILTSILLHCGANIFSIAATATGGFFGILEDTFTMWLYIVVMAVATLFLLDYIYRKGAAKVLIPAEEPQQEEP